MRWTEEEYQDYLSKRRMLKGNMSENVDKASDRPSNKQKYGNKIVQVDGIKFRSQKEADKYQELKLRLKAGDIKGFCMQPKFVLMEGNEEDRAITYAADFVVFYNDNTFEIVDTKGYESAQWERTFKMFRLKYPGLELKVEK